MTTTECWIPRPDIDRWRDAANPYKVLLAAKLIFCKIQGNGTSSTYGRTLDVLAPNLETQSG